jgi:flagellar hook-basal body complex protein FliE
MSSARRILVALTIVASLLASACGDPPDKEIQQAQGAIDAARAAGADRYAPDEFAAAVAALKNAQAAVTQRDYRLALNNALDSRERAQTAAKEADDQKAKARSDAERVLIDVMAALNDAHTRLKTAETAHAPARVLAESRRTITDADTAVPKARALLKDGDYLTVIGVATPLIARLQATAQGLDAAAPAPVRRRR